MKRKRPAPPDLHVVSGDSGRSGDASPDGDAVFSVQHLTYIEARSAGETIKNAALSARPPIPYSTARRLDDDVRIRAEIRSRAREAVQCGTMALGSAAATAARTLKSVAASGGPGDGPRVSAAKAILEIGSRALELEDLQAELAEIKSQLGAPNRPFRRTPP